MGEVAMVIAYESPDARALIFQRMPHNEKTLKIDEEGWMDGWMCGRRCKKTSFFFVVVVVVVCASRHEIVAAFREQKKTQALDAAHWKSMV